MQKDISIIYPARRSLVVLFFAVLSCALIWRAFYLQVSNKEFLRTHGDARSLRVVNIPVKRGMITDRNNEPLAISTPVDSVWAVPARVLENPESVPLLADALSMETESLGMFLRERTGREFVYLRRQVSPDQARAVNDLEIYGVYLQREFKRYYPASEIASHLIGFTNIDDSGQEGLELAYDHWLKGTPGTKRVLKDRLGRIVRDVESIQAPVPGRDLALSIDRRIQYLAYRELSAAVKLHNANSGSLVLLDVQTGEVIALAAQPSYNPNNRTGLRSDHYRNRAVIDVFEPGSTLKPFTAAAAIMSGIYKPETTIETAPGFFKVGNHVIHDISNYGTLDLGGVVRKSSNVGSSKIALAIGPEPIWHLYRSLGFGVPTGSGFPGESPGIFYDYANWSELDLAAIGFGHGLAVTALQLAQAYAVIAGDGVLRPVTFLKTDRKIRGTQVVPEKVARQVRKILEGATGPGGTGHRASIPLYRIAGKTGTTHKADIGGYSEDRYMSLFAGMAPASAPRLVLVVVIDEPKGDKHYGGEVAAPVFSRIMQDALRIFNIPPDDLPALEKEMLLAVRAGSGPDAGYQDKTR